MAPAEYCVCFSNHTMQGYNSAAGMTSHIANHITVSAICASTRMSMILARQSSDLLKAPDVIGKSSFHRWSDSQRLVNPNEIIVVKKMQSWFAPGQPLTHYPSPTL
jgi:hypothetical protein